MKAGIDRRMQPHLCLGCGESLDAGFCAYKDGGRDAVPSPGSIMICIYCGHAMALTEKFITRELTEAEAADLAGDKEIQVIIQAYKQRAETDVDIRKNPKKVPDA